MSSPFAANWANDSVSMMARSLLGSVFVTGGMMGLAILIGRRKGLYKIPIKLAALLLCFYGSALAVSSYMEGIPALVPYCLITFRVAARDLLVNRISLGRYGTQSFGEDSADLLHEIESSGPQFSRFSLGSRDSLECSHLWHLQILKQSKERNQSSPDWRT